MDPDVLKTPGFVAMKPLRCGLFLSIKCCDLKDLRT